MALERGSWHAELARRGLGPDGRPLQQTEQQAVVQQPAPTPDQHAYQGWANYVSIFVLLFLLSFIRGLRPMSGADKLVGGLFLWFYSFMFVTCMSLIFFRDPYIATSAVVSLPIALWLMKRRFRQTSTVEPLVVDVKAKITE